jgi:hypothetical protein
VGGSIPFGARCGIVDAQRKLNENLLKAKGQAKGNTVVVRTTGALDKSMRKRFRANFVPQNCGRRMRNAFIQLGIFVLGCAIAFQIEFMLFGFYAASMTSFGAFQQTAVSPLELYAVPAHLWGRGRDGPEGIDLFLVPLVWGGLSYGIFWLFRFYWSRSNAA